MALLQLEQNKHLSGNYPSVAKAPTGRSFDQAQQDKAILMQAKRAVAASSFAGSSSLLVNPNSSFHLENYGMGDVNNKGESVASSDRVSELRRRRLYEMHHNRPYSSQTKPKKKFKFWEQEKPSPFHQFGTTSTNGRTAAASSVANVPEVPRRVSSFSDYQDLSTPAARRHYREVTFQDDALMEHSFRGLGSSSYEFDSSWIHPSSGNKLYMMQNNFENDDEYEYDEDEEPSDIPLHSTPRRALWNEQASALQAQMQNLALHNMKKDEDKDEIMDGLVYDSDEIMTPIKDRKYITIPTTTTAKADKTTTENTGKVALVSPDASSLIAPLNSTVSFETPEKVPVPIVATAANLEDVAARQITPSCGLGDETVLSPPNAPKKERIHKAPTVQDNKVDTTKEAADSSAPATVDTLCTAGFTDVIPMEEGGEAIGAQPMTAVKLTVSPDTGVIQWQSLRRNGNGEFAVTKSSGSNSKRIASMREVTTTIQELADQKFDSDSEASNNSMLKLFVDLYQQSTYDEIIQNIPEIKDQGTLVICRGFDFSASTFNNVAEVRSLLEALKNVEKLDSIMLLNLRPESMVDLAKVLNQHPFMFRLQLHLQEGTLNGELLGVMATAPRLTHVQLDMKETCAIGILMNSKSIQSLRITSKGSNWQRAT